MIMEITVNRRKTLKRPHGARRRIELLLTVSCPAGTIKYNFHDPNGLSLDDLHADGASLLGLHDRERRSHNKQPWLARRPVREKIAPWGCVHHHRARPCHITRSKRLLCQTAETSSPAALLRPSKQGTATV